uniref:OSJNBa0089E12.4 protein n=1 Tax=Oryza sativa subsp. japonica TaxID=39947 RepID=Q7XQM0_ORYSJ|nr:OSJNBa0089E12.4 [Oryza sativa Japonica Group]
MARGPMDLWNQWATQILVLLSLTLQVVLHIFAGVRRRKATPVERFILWLAYQLADSTAIYAVGNLSLSSTAREHNLVAFWAPFLLLHLGGPDNITAYSLEDNKLWKRHLVTLVVQVLGVGYVLYKNIAGNGMMIVVAAILMSVVGTAKYGERTYALWWSNFGTIGNYLKLVQRDKHQHFYIKYEHPRHLGDNHGSNDELLLHRAHSLFHVCKRGIVDSVIINDDDDSDNPDSKVIGDLLMQDKDHKSMWTVITGGETIFGRSPEIHNSLGSTKNRD